MITPLPSPDFLELHYRDDLLILLGRWTRPITLEESRRGYTRMLEAARQHHARFWLLDIRRRPRVDSANVEWLVGSYYPELPLALGGTVYLAYLLAPDLKRELAASGLVPADEAYEGQSFQMGKFTAEQEATAWLQAKQVAEKQL
ncbi:hypothetical protein MUN84_15305 [Hymenobacter sp. 5516J-16]|uniref:hypothetical protein n=1 Tax=Hymenobacter sp. 5516J-16 TaxID=2932253 RepID=UPI001FD509D6|nr:hypothetical protein [Hymenobacter sp. 5516J-16]UOQ75978.1 hypothetical protein MUN84_15305 [Hymenobacter sp. 5516J-16]